MAEVDRVVIGYVDTHKDVHVAAVVNEVGKIIDSESFPATPGAIESSLLGCVALARDDLELDAAVGQLAAVDLDRHRTQMTATIPPWHERSRQQSSHVPPAEPDLSSTSDHMDRHEHPAADVGGDDDS